MGNNQTRLTLGRQQEEQRMARKRRKQAIPKRLGGVKIPKPVRRGLRQFIDSQSGRALAVEAIGALGAAFAASQAKRGSLARSRLADADLSGAAGSTSAAVKFAMGEAIRSFSENLKRGKAEADARAAWPEGSEPASKKKSRSEPEQPQH